MKTVKVEEYVEREAGLPKKCDFRYEDEMIGFEGQPVEMCCHREHPGAVNIYPRCKTIACPILKRR
jgi:hypothetical protein